MAKPSAAKSKKVTAENLVGLGAERLAEILADVAETRVDLKRRLRIELAAQQGPGPLSAEIDKRLGAFETSRGQITWRQRPAFIRDLDAVRDLIVARLAPLDAPAATERLWRFMDTAIQSARRYRERNGELEAVFQRAAADLGRLLVQAPSGPAAATLVDSIVRNGLGWKGWLPSLLAEAPRSVAEDALRILAEKQPPAGPGRIAAVRELADAAGDVEAYRATWTSDALKTPTAAIELASRYLAAGDVEQAGHVLRAAAPSTSAGRRTAAPDFDWETLWIDYLERSGRAEEAQAIRWASFERTLSPERARAFIARLDDFEDVEAEARAFEVARRAERFQTGLSFLMNWRALGEASRMIEARVQDVEVEPDLAELWAGKLRRRYPKAAYHLLRKGAAAAFRKRDFKTCDRLSAEADSIAV